MGFESLQDFMSMCYVAPMGVTRCHGGFVWAAYGIAAVVLIANVVAVIRRRRRLVKQIQRQVRRDQKGML